MKSKIFISMTMKTIIWIFGVLLLCNSPGYCQAKLPSAPPQGMPHFPMGNQKEMGINFAGFFDRDAHTVLWGKEDGIKLFDITQKKELGFVLSGKQITALRVDPVQRNSALAATDDGEAFRIDYQNSILSFTKIDQLSQDPVGIIRLFIFFKSNPSIVLAADSKNIYRSRDGGRTWEMQNPIRLPDPNQRIVCIMQSPRKRNSFLVSTTHAGRYLGKWTGNQLISVPEKAIPHGHVVIKSGISYIPIGSNSDVFPFKFEKLLILDAATLDNLVYAVGIGNSPIKYSIDKGRITIKFINQRLNMSYSVDVAPENSEKLLIASSKGLFLSNDAGASWSSIL